MRRIGILIILTLLMRAATSLAAENAPLKADVLCVEAEKTSNEKVTEGNFVAFFRTPPDVKLLDGDVAWIVSSGDGFKSLPCAVAFYSISAIPHGSDADFAEMVVKRPAHSLKGTALTQITVVATGTVFEAETSLRFQLRGTVLDPNAMSEAGKLLTAENVAMVQQLSPAEQSKNPLAVKVAFASLVAASDARMSAIKRRIAEIQDLTEVAKKALSAPPVQVFLLQRLVGEIQARVAELRRFHGELPFVAASIDAIEAAAPKQPKP